MSDIFGPWTPPGTGGKQPTDGNTPGPDTPAVLTTDQFWDSRTEGYVQLHEAPPWQRCKLGPYDLPGIVEVDAPGAQQTIDAKAAQAKGGETLTVKGWTSSDVTITCTLWTPKHLETWREVHAGIAPELQEKHDALDISAECLTGTSIKSVLIRRVQPLKRGQVVGTKVGVIEAKQFVEKPKTTSTGTPNGSKSNVSDKEREAAYWAVVQAYQALLNAGTNIPWKDFLASSGWPADWPPPPVGPPAA